MLKALYLLSHRDLIYSPADQARIAALVDIIGPPQHDDLPSRAPEQQSEQLPEQLAEVEVILSGWGMARLDEAFLAAAPRLRAVFYGAGSIRGFMTDAAWARGLTICSAWAANAAPVAEYALAQILLCLKRAHPAAAACRAQGPAAFSAYPRFDVAGAYEATVGLIGLGMIGRRMTELLRPFDVRLLAHDPFASPDTAARLGVELVSLAELFARADVVSLHAPLLDSTRGMLGAEHFAAMKPHAAFINTARGAIVRQDELIAVLEARPDLFAVLDVTDPEPPPEGSPLYRLPNVYLTPHLAGSVGRECHRLGQYMADELERYLAGEPLRWSITREQAALLA